MSDPRRVAVRNHYHSPRFRLDEETFALAEGDCVVRPVVHHPGAVAIVAQPSPQRLVLVRQYRYPIQAWTLEIPAGTRESGEEPLATAQRELAEEAGLAAQTWQELTRFYPAVGVSDEEMILYRAQDLHPAMGDPDHGELVQVEEVACEDLPHLISRGNICDAKTLMACAILGVWPC
ncbi:MAG: NUDIX hydrolase [Planctomycetota bacterium]|nr:MAG: NUDIX hydrolase [Planctomycetota bacterium]